MSYSIFIGNVYMKDNRDDDPTYELQVERVSLNEAPCWLKIPDKYGHIVDISGKTNSRHPGYSQMADFCRETDIHKLWYNDEDGILARHPGVVVLQQKHLDVIRTARIKWEKEHPNAKPGWNDDEDPILARLLWYEWWMDWALKNCQYPGIENY